MRLLACVLLLISAHCCSGFVQSHAWRAQRRARLCMCAGPASRRQSLVSLSSSLLLLSSTLVLDKQRVFAADEEEGTEKGHKDTRSYLQDVDKLNINVPDFKKGLEWINTAPVSLVADLRGKLVLMDFWTYCCINCMHILPSLATLEDKYAQEPFAVIGVHSAKFANEKVSSNIRAAIDKYRIQHPVVNDRDMTMWNTIGVSSWPTQVLLGPRGNILAMWSGEGYQSAIDSMIAEALAFYREKGELNEAPFTPRRLSSGMTNSKGSETPLKYPGKIAYTASNGGMLAVSDTGNNRIMLVKEDGTVLSLIGGLSAGLKDGSFESARFSSPQGVCFFDYDTLIVADTENHAVRCVDLKNRQVTTLAGTGMQGSDYTGGAAGAAQALSSPWDVERAPAVLGPDFVLVAMAGTHQLWSVNVRSGVARKYSGTGRELHMDALRPGQDASWAQPSGLALNSKGERVAVADSESSTVRLLSVRNNAARGDNSNSYPYNTRTVAGGLSPQEDPSGRNLFAFGDKDGIGFGVRFQHPLGVAFVDDTHIVVADTYNHKLKLVDTDTGRVRTLAGSGVAGLRDGVESAAQFWEPSGLCIAQKMDNANGAILYVADTNNHLVRRVEIVSGRVDTLRLSLPAALSSSPFQEPKKKASIVNRKRAQLKSVGPVGTQSDVMLRVALPQGYHFTKGAPSRWQLVADEGILGTETTLEGALVDDDKPVRIHIAAQREGTVELEVAIYFCEDGGPCRTMSTIFTLSLQAQGPVAVDLTQEIPLPPATGTPMPTRTGIARM